MITEEDGEEYGEMNPEKAISEDCGCCGRDVDWTSNDCEITHEWRPQYMKSLQTAVILKSLKASGLTNQDIIQLVKSEGWPAVRKLAG